tara:strand:- start:995 stop:1609 length:615 start_codon:yes stop_codon:yes gene_type:complete
MRRRSSRRIGRRSRRVFSRRRSRRIFSSGRINQRKPQVSIVASKSKVTANRQIVMGKSKPTVFATKPFRITRPTSRFYRTTRRPSVLMRYNRPTIDYSSRYRSAVAKNRALTVALSKQKADAKIAAQKHAEEKAKFKEMEDAYRKSPGFQFDRTASEVTKRFAKATKVISPSINGIGGMQETASWAGASLIGLLALGLIIGRVE